MISTKRCRQILGASVQLTDEELERVREDLYALAHVIVDIAARRKAQEKQGRAPADEREDRAA